MNFFNPFQIVYMTLYYLISFHLRCWCEVQGANDLHLVFPFPRGVVDRFSSKKT